MNRFASIALVAASLLVVPMIAGAAGETPDAAIRFSGKSVAVGVGYSHATGTLEYRGRSYPVELDGFSVVSVGATTFTATGDVYHLARVEDLNGNYVAGSAGATLAGGGTLTTMENQNGVVIRLKSTNEGLQFNLSIDGVAIKLAQR